MSRNYTGPYVKITKDDKEKLKWLLEHTEDVKRLADWLGTNVDTINRWSACETKKFRSEARERINKLYGECQTPPQEIAAEPTVLRGIFDRLNHISKGGSVGSLLRDVVRDLAVYMIEQGEV